MNLMTESQQVRLQLLSDLSAWAREPEDPALRNQYAKTLERLGMVEADAHILSHARMLIDEPPFNQKLFWAEHFLRESPGAMAYLVGEDGHTIDISSAGKSYHDSAQVAFARWNNPAGKTVIRKYLSGIALSPDDVRYALKNHVAEIRTLSPAGRCVMRFARAYEAPEYLYLTDVQAECLEKVGKRLKAMLDLASITEEQYNADIYHEANSLFVERVGNDYGITYERQSY